MAVNNINATLQSIVGPYTPVADGSYQDRLRAGKTGELIVADRGAKFYEAVSRGKVFCACNQTVITFGTALTATGVTFTLTNPYGSGYNLALLSCGVTFVTSSTAGSLVYAYNYNAATAVVHGTPLIVRNAKLDLSSGVGLADGAATIPAAPVAIRTLASGFTTNANMSVRDYVDGQIVIAPGSSVTVQGITIVGTGLIDMFWEEVALQG